MKAIEITDADIERAIDAHMGALADQDRAANRPAPLNPKLSDVTENERVDLMNAMRCAVTAALTGRVLNG